MMLHEGNAGTGFTGDDVHGSHNFVTAFRNYWIGWEPGKTAQTNPIKLYAFNRYMNFVGNVLGRTGFHAPYEWNVSGSSEDPAIFNLGSATNNSPSDALVKTTLCGGAITTRPADGTISSQARCLGLSPYGTCSTEPGASGVVLLDG